MQRKKAVNHPFKNNLFTSGTQLLRSIAKMVLPQQQKRVNRKIHWPTEGQDIQRVLLYHLFPPLIIIYMETNQVKLMKSGERHK